MSLLIKFHYRELSFKKGDILYIRRQIDKNWYEGEHNAQIGLLPVQYVDVSSLIIEFLFYLLTHCLSFLARHT